MTLSDEIKMFTRQFSEVECSQGVFAPKRVNGVLLLYTFLFLLIKFHIDMN
jgi:hypothetical protein